MVFGQKIRENGAADGFNGSKAQLPGELRGICHSVFGLSQIPHDGRGVFIENLSLMGQGGLLSNAVKEMDSQLLFQLLDLNGDSCLRVSQLPGGF